MGSGGDMSNGNIEAGTGEAFCLRWNNHKSNLVEIIESLIKMECYVDCTIYVDNHVQFKAHRMVLAASSLYFRMILNDAPQDHCSIILPGVQEFEMRALLEYIYAGEVNIPESLIPRVIKIAKMLDVKGLMEGAHISQQPPPTSPPDASLFLSPNVSAEGKREISLHMLMQSLPIINPSPKISSKQSSSSPPYQMSYISNFAPGQEPSEDRRQLWGGLPSSLSRSNHSMLSSVYEMGSDMNPLKRKKLSSINSMLLTRDTPILRNVLAQSNASDPTQVAPSNAHSSPMRGSNGIENNENNDTNNNENGVNVNAGGSSGGHNGSIYVGYMRKSSDRSYHSSNGSDNSDKVSVSRLTTSSLATNTDFSASFLSPRQAEVQRRRAIVALHRSLV